MLLLNVKDSILGTHEMDRETFRQVIRSEQVWEQWVQLIWDTVWEFVWLLIIIVITGWMFSWQEGWNIANSVYFVFTTASTIGFGDFKNFYKSNITNGTKKECETHGTCTFHEHTITSSPRVGRPGCSDAQSLLNTSNFTECL